MNTTTSTSNTNYSKIFESWVNVEHVALGKKLKPFCLLHLLWLNQIASPLVNTSQPVTMRDLELAVMICSSTSSEEILQLLDRKQSLLERFKRWRWYRSNAERDLQAEVLLFIAYHDDYLALPAFADRAAGEVSNECIPWIMSCMANAVKETGWSEQEILTMPIGKLFWYGLTFSYLATGKTNIISDAEQQAIAMLKALPT